MSARAGWWLVAAGAVAWTAVLWPLHDRLPLWVEGLPNYIDQLLGVFRRACAPPPFVLDIGGRLIPLGIDAYQGPLMTWLDVPVTRLWLGGAIDDLYAYRYKGILLHALAALMLYPLLLRIAAPLCAALGALVLATLPVASVVAISDLQYHTVVLCAVCGIVWPLARFAETGRRGWLVIGAFAAGLSLLTRAEVLVWSAAAIIVWVVIARRALIGELRRAVTPGVAVAALAAFALGAAPTIAMNVQFPHQGLAAFLLTGGTREAGLGSLASFFPIRLVQFDKFVLRNGFWLYAVPPLHVVFMLVALLAVAAALVDAWRKRRWSLALVALLVVLPLSVASNRGPRDIHLLPLVIPVIALVTALAARLPLRVGAGLLMAVIAANVWVGARVLDHWEELRRANEDTLATKGCPECLAVALARYPQRRVVHTNLGLYGEALWASRGHDCGIDIHHREADFGQAVLSALAYDGAKIFVAIPPEREAVLVAEGRAYARNARLLAALADAGLPFTSDGVRDAQGTELYRLYVVTDRLPAIYGPTGGGINAPASGRITGWITGHGFQSGDTVLIDGSPVATTFGAADLLTFSVPTEAISEGRSYRIEIARGNSRSAGLQLRPR